MMQTRDEEVKTSEKPGDLRAEEWKIWELKALEHLCESKGSVGVDFFLYLSTEVWEGQGDTFH